jgi:hypothetical protein
MKDKLFNPLPPEAITKHPTKSYLSSIKAIYVTERFTEVFGVGKWTTKVEKEYVNYETGMVVVKVTFEVPDHGIYYECFGGNDNGGAKSKNFDLGDAYKGATTDALTKIGSYMGVGIDVFKGKGALPQKEELKPNTAKWNDAIDYLKNQAGTIEVIKKKYIINDENEKLLTDAV